MSREPFETLPEQHDSEIPQSGVRRADGGRARFHELFSSDSKDSIGDTSYQFLGDEISDATTMLSYTEQNRMKDVMQARRNIRKRFRRAA